MNVKGENVLKDKIKLLIANNKLEILMFIGAIFIIIASFLVNFILGLYALGLMFWAMVFIYIKAVHKKGK